jgi:polyhydroxybutyrate depolymerase
MKNSFQFLVLFLLLFVFNAVDETTFSQVQTGSFFFEGVYRNYIVYFPQNYNGVDKLPLVFNLHGYTLNAMQQMNYSRMNQVADTAGFIVVYPNAIQATWNCGVSGGPNVNDVGFIAALIDTMDARYSIDETRIYICGFSRGGFMSNRLACEISNRFAAFAAVAGTIANSLTGSCIPDRHIPMLYFHGTNDPMVPYGGNNERQAVDSFITHWTKFNLCTESDSTFLPNLDTLDGCTVQRITHTNCEDSTKIIFYKILNGGHTWPGGNPTYLVIPGYDMGNTNFDVNASEMMWDFFKNYHLAEPTVVDDDKQVPIIFYLSQNYPNPFNPSTKITWQTPVSSWQTLKVYDVLGNEVKTLLNNEMEAGHHSIDFNASELPCGVYFYRIQAGNYIDTKKMILLR